MSISFRFWLFVLVFSCLYTVDTLFFFTVAQRVVERGQHKVNNKKIEVSLQQPNQRRPKTQSSTDAEPPSESLCIVRVDGISNVKSMETLQYYFENAKRSGGGEMEDSGFEVYEEDDAVYITYKEEEGMYEPCHEKTCLRGFATR